MAADGDRAVNVMQHVVTDAAEDRPSDRAETASTENDHRGALLSRQVHYRLARILTELHHHAAVHLSHNTNQRRIREQDPERTLFANETCTCIVETSC